MLMNYAMMLMKMMKYLMQVVIITYSHALIQAYLSLL